jgi:hypothetical protein
MSVTASSASATMTADEIIVATALSGRTHRLASFNKTINLATTGAGGMDTGAAPASGYVAIYAIYNPTTQTAALLATNATSAKRPEVYGGANMPAGYTASALVSVWATSGSSQLLPGLQSDREIDVGQFGALSTSTQQASTTALSIAGAVPKNAKTVSGSHQIGSTTNSVSTGILTPTAQGGMGTQAVVANIPGAGNVTAIFSRLKISTPQTIYYSATATGGTMGYTINVSGYSF